MLILLIKLLIAHVIGDFVFQPDRWVEDKRKKKHRSYYFYLHGLIHLLALLVVLEFDWSYWFSILIIVISHLIIDFVKLNLEKKLNSRLLFTVDQALHLFILGIVVYINTPFQINWGKIYSIESLSLILSLLTVTYVCSIIVKVIMSKWIMKDDKPEDSLINAGKYIGMLERLLVFGFIVLNQWSAIGFLITAKSVFRFSDLSRAKDRKLTEYILIGTLISFTLAISIGLAYQYLINLV